MDFQSLNDDDEDGAELFFEEPEADPVVPDRSAADDAIALALASIDFSQPDPPPPARKTAKVKAIAPVAGAPAPPPPVEIVSDAAPGPSPTATAPVAAVPRQVTIALVLAVVAALFSAIGMIVVARNVAALTEQRTVAEERAAAFARLPALLAQVERLAVDQQALLARQSAAVPIAPVTAADLSRQLDGLRFVMAKSQSPGTTALAGVVRQGQADLAHRIDEVNDRIDKVEGRSGH